MSVPADPDPRFRRAVRRAPPWFLSVLLHVALAALVLAPFVLPGGAEETRETAYPVIIGGLDRGDGGVPAEEPGEGPPPVPERPEAPAPGPQLAPEPPPKADAPDPGVAQESELRSATPTPADLAAALERIRGTVGVAGTPRAGSPAAGGSPTGSPGALGGIRSATGRAAGVARHGGSRESEGAVEAGLRWLARHQDEDGRWDGDRFSDRCSGGAGCLGPGYSTYDVGLTGLALAAFAGAGYGPGAGAPGTHGATVSRGLDFLREEQRRTSFEPLDDGFFDKTDMYNHAVATLAFAECYGVTGAPGLREPLERAVAALTRAQQARGGWNYHAHPTRPRNDASITGFAIQALVSARESGVRVPDEVLARAARFLREQTSPETGRVRYADSGVNDLREGLGLVGVSVLCRLLLGDDPAEPGLARGIAILAGATPELDRDPRPRSVDRGHYPVYYGTVASFVAGGDAWSRWNPAAQRLLLAPQRTAGCARGSWDPEGMWGANGGRVYATAISVLTLEVYYKYLPGYLGARVEAAGEGR